MKVLYTAVGTARGGRAGQARSDDGKLDVQLAVPQSMGGAAKEGTNPEQLFACGYAACFGSAIDHVAKLRKTPVKDINVRAQVQLGMKPDGAFLLAVELSVWLPEVSKEQARVLVDEAHRVCPYSNATRGNVEVLLVVSERAI